MRLISSVIFSVLLLSGGNASAAFVSVTSGGMIKTVGSSGVDSVLNTYDENTIQWGFLESTNVSVTDLRVDRAIPTTGAVSNAYNPNNSSTFRTISGLVDSHMIFLNRNGSGNSWAEWTFSTEILGVMSDAGGLLEARSTALLGSSSVLYPVAGSGGNTGALGGNASQTYVGFGNRGLETGNIIKSSASLVTSGDAYHFSGNKLTLSMSVTQPGDWIRVITRTSQAPGPVVPEPASAVLFSFGVVGLCFARRSIRRS